MRTIISIVFLTFLTLVFANPAQADPPVLLRPIDDVVVDEDPGVTIIADLDNIFEDPDGRQIEFFLGNVPGELNMDIEEDNVLFFNPMDDFYIHEGVQITVGAVNARGEANETQFRLTIIPVNDPPILINEIDDIVVDEDCGLTLIADLDDVFFDVDADELNFSFENDIEELNLGIDDDNVLFFNPENDFNLENGVDITVTAEDGDGESVSDIFWLAIMGGGPPPPPVEPIADVEVNEDCGLTLIADLDDVFFDVDGDELVYSFDGAPNELNMDIDQDNILSINPVMNYNLADGVEITVSAENPDGMMTEDAFTIVIRPVNDAPVVIAEIADREYDPNPGRVDIADLDEVFVDVDGDELRFDFGGAPEELNMQIDEDNILIFDPDEDFVLPDGVEITITAEDPDGEAAEDTFIITIQPAGGPMIVVEPAEIDFGEVMLGDRVRIEFEVRNEGDEDLIMENVVCDNEVFWVDEQDIWFEWPPWPPEEPFMSILIQTAEINGDLLQEDDWIAVFTPEGILAGAEQAEEFPMGIAVHAENWGGEIFRNGDDLEFRYWIVDEEREVIAEAEYIMGDGEWHPNGMAVVDLTANNRFEPADLDEPIILEPGESVVLVAHFEPQEAGVYESELIVLSNDFRGEEFVIPVFGFCFDEEPPVVWDPIAPLVVEEDAGLVIIADLDDVFIDPNGDELVFMFEGAPDEMNMGIDDENFLFINPDQNYNLPRGVVITLIAENANGMMVELVFAIVIQPVNDIPEVIQEINDQIFDINPGRIEIVDLNVIFFDVDGDVMTYSAEGDPDELNLQIDDDCILSIEPDQGFSVPDGVEITVLAEDPDGESVGDVFMLTINEPELVEQVIELNQGWNLVSLNIIPERRYWRIDAGPDVVLLMADIVDVLFIVKDENGLFYTPRFGFINIPFWDLQEAYQINVTEECVLIIEGIPLPLDEEIQLERGWNLLGFAPDFELDASAPEFYVLSPIIENVLIAKDGLGRFMTPEFRFSNMPPWRPGQGYQVNVDADVAFVYPPEREEELNLVGEHRNFLPSASTGSNMSLLLNYISGSNVQPGDRITVLSSDNLLVGKGIINNDLKCGLAVWGDDELTDQIDGLRNDEMFSIVLLNNNEQFQVTTSEVLLGSGLRYKTDEFTVLNVTVQTPVPEDFYISTAYPNPFNSTTRISYGLPEDVEVSIQTYDITGCLVETLVSGKQLAGHYSLTWNAGSNPTGVYLIRLETEQFSRVTKVILEK